MQKEVFAQFQEKKPTILYAPTWNDHESSSSFNHAILPLLNNLPNHYNLLIKLHPNMTLQTDHYDPKPTLKIISQYSSKPNILFLPFYPLVYPILAHIDYYIGDHSSVSYDMLPFAKPMFFLNTQARSKKDPGAHIFCCGTVIEPENYQYIYSIIQESKPQLFTDCQKKTYQYAFGCDQETPMRLQELDYKLQLFEAQALV